jgi:hypothetical protein
VKTGKVRFKENVLITKAPYTINPRVNDWKEFIKDSVTDGDI